MCRECLQTPCHPSCPNYSPTSNPNLPICNVCNEPILTGEEYWENSMDEVIHEDCVSGMSWREFAAWCGAKIKIMGEYD